MAFFDNIFSRKEELDVDDYLNNMEVEEEPEEVDFWVKPISLQTNAEVEEVIRELKERNIVLLDIENLSKRNAQRAKQFLGQIKMFVKDTGGDLAMVSASKILLTPSKVKIKKK
ncbi:MAG TPA: cell division protein SepF [archaeon]|nr:cell division protein SepF [archaeon]HPV66112.1 cell division protein SepF [archaeon]